MSEGEQQGWHRLATRVQALIPSPGEGPLADAIVALQQAAPASAQGATGSTGIDSDAWRLAGTTVTEACEAEGFTVALEGFVGG